MVRWRTAGCASGVSFLALLVLTGCPNATGLLGELDNDGGAAPATEGEVFKTLAAAEKAFEIGDDEELDSSDENEYFGEDAELYDDADDSKVEVSEDAIAGDVANEDGERPVLHGTLAGQFLTDDSAATSDDSGGVFRGQWLNADGETDGYLRGHFKPVAAGALPTFITGGGYFRGKLVDPDGRFRGRLRGVYGHIEDDRTLFVGRWFDRHERLLGVLRGHWTDAAAGGGEFAGRWAAFNLCGESEKLDELPFDAGDFGGLDQADVDLTALDASGDPGLVTATENESDDGDVSLDPDDMPLDAELDLDTDGSGLCIDADLPHGFIRGWHRPNADDESANSRGDGVFRADWRDRDGLTSGYVVGHYESRASSDGNADDSGSDDGAGDDGDAADDHSDSADNDDGSAGDAEDPVDDSADSADDGASSETESRPARGGRDANANQGGGSAPGQRGATAGGNGDKARMGGVFYGKWYNSDGSFGGYVRGAFGQGPHGLGVFRGKYFNADGLPRGVLRGRWDDAPREEGGPMFGVWVGVELGDGNDDSDDGGDGSDDSDDEPSDEPVDPNASAE